MIRAICSIVYVTLAFPANSQEKQPMKLVATTPLPDFSGDFDHFGVDLKGNRLFLTAEEHKSVEVFDLKTGKRIHSITGFEEPHALVYLPDTDRLIVTDGNEKGGMVRLVNGKDYKFLDTVKLLPNVDAGIFNAVNSYYYVEVGGSASKAQTHLLSIIDTKTFKHIGDITIPGNRSEGMAIDRAGKKLYVNLTGTDEVGVVDLDTRQLVAKWPVPDAHVENSMALDEPNHRLFIATRQPAKFFVYNTDTGKVVTVLPCTGVNDDMWFDSVRKRIYVTGSGTASVFEQQDADHYRNVAEVHTGYRARTSIFVPSLNRLYVAVSAKGKPEAKMSLQIYELQP